MIPIAHAGHWAAQIAYLLPLIVLGGALIWGRIKRRRSKDDSDV